MAKKNQKYMLISVCDREILTEQFKSHEEAHDAMKNEFLDSLRCSPDEDLMEAIYSGDYDDGDMGFGEWSAYSNDGMNHANYDWLIVAL